MVGVVYDKGYFMSICSDAIQCKNTTVSVVDAATTDGSIKHNVNIKQSATILGVNYPLMSFIRTFSADWHKVDDSGIYAMVDVTDQGLVACAAGHSTHSGTVSEDCTQSMIIPMYLNITDKIFVYKKIVETIKFEVNAHPKLAGFKGKWGVQYFWKFVIHKKDNEFLKRIESFHVVNGTVDKEVSTITSYTNPFPEVSAAASWGLYGNMVYHTNTETTVDSTIRQILVIPNPPSLSIPQDFGDDATPSVNNYGFYDYNATEAGFIPSTLGAEDGGKDFYYPYWLRQMTENTYMRTWADNKWSFLADKATPVASDTWTPPEPLTYTLPFGSFVKDPAGNYIHSALFEHSNGTAVVYNDSNIKDLFTKILTYGEPRVGGEAVYYPITVISSMNTMADITGSSVNDPRQLTFNGIKLTVNGENLDG